MIDWTRLICTMEEPPRAAKALWADGVPQGVLIDDEFFKLADNISGPKVFVCRGSLLLQLTNVVQTYSGWLNLWRPLDKTGPLWTVPGSDIHETSEAAVKEKKPGWTRVATIKVDWSDLAPEYVFPPVFKKVVPKTCGTCAKFGRVCDRVGRDEVRDCWTNVPPAPMF